MFLCQLEIAICERMTRVSRALSAVLFAFPPAKGTMLDDAGKKKKRDSSRPRNPESLLRRRDAARFRYLFKCPPCPSASS